MSAPRRLLITGGARGIGRATALAAAAQGWPVVFGYHADAAAAAETLAAIRAFGVPAEALRGDVGDEGDVAALFDLAERVMGGVDVVVINAGIAAPALPLAQISAERIVRMVRTNLTGALLTAREAARRIDPATSPVGEGAIVFVGSAAARLGSPGEYVDYAATKGALDSLTLGLAKELGPQRIRVNCVRPGVIETDIHAAGGDPGRAQRIGAGVPLGRAGEAEEVAAAVLWLAGPQAGYATGALLDLAGGR